MDKDVVRMYTPTHPDPHHSHTHTPNINTHHGILLSHKKNKIMSFTATYIDLDIIIRNELCQRKTNII